MVKKERPDVEKKKNDLLVSMASDKLQLNQLEEKILRMLRDSEGVVVDNVGLIETLGESKVVSKTISERLIESEKTNAQITTMREQYRPVATRGSIIYFVMADLARIDPMYQFSLSYFQRLYDLCIDEADKSDDLDTRLENLKAYMTLNVYKNVCRGLFEAHKLIFSFLVCIQILREAQEVSTSEWSLLLKGAGMVTNKKQNPMPDSVSENGWNLLAALEEGVPDKFTALVDHIVSPATLPQWQEWAACDDPHSSPLPKPWCDQLNSMQRMLVLKAFREEKLVFAIQDFVVEHLGEEFVQSPPVSMKVVHGETRADTPVVFILSVGADPTGVLYTYAKEVDYMDRLHLCSLGQGQGARAEALINRAKANGDWVLLQNCHLGKSWMPSLEAICDELADCVRRQTAGASDGTGPIPGSPEYVHPDFRLWLTSMPAPYFPVPVL